MNLTQCLLWSAVVYRILVVAGLALITYKVSNLDLSHTIDMVQSGPVMTIPYAGAGDDNLHQLATDKEGHLIVKCMNCVEPQPKPTPDAQIQTPPGFDHSLPDKDSAPGAYQLGPFMRGGNCVLVAKPNGSEWTCQ